MATFVDISIIKNFSVLFTFILVFVLIYGMMEVFKVFGEGRNGLHAIIAVVIAFLVSISAGVTAVIQTFTPWFTIIIIVIFFILFAVRMFGVDTATITKTFMDHTAILTFILIFAVVILLFSLGAGFGQQTLEEGQGKTTTSTTGADSGNTTTATSATNTGSFNQNLYNTIYHPKILGMILMMLIVVVAMLLLTSASSP